MNILTDATDDAFCELNTTSIWHIKIAAMGFNGPKARFLALGVLQRFIEWRKTQPLHYKPKSGLEEIPSADCIQKDLNFLKGFSPDYSDKYSIVDNFFEFKNKYNNKGLLQKIFDYIG